MLILIREASIQMIICARELKGVMIGKHEKTVYNAIEIFSFNFAFIFFFQRFFCSCIAKT